MRFIMRFIFRVAFSILFYGYVTTIQADSDFKPCHDAASFQELTNTCSDNKDCTGYYKNKMGEFVLKCGERGLDAICIPISARNQSLAGKKHCVLPPSEYQDANWRASLAGTITGNVIKTAQDIVNFTFEEWISSLTNTKTFITGNYTFAEKYYNSFCYSAAGCREENAFDFIEDNYRLNINSSFIKANKVTTYQFPYDLLPYSLLGENLLSNPGARIGAEQMANNLIFDEHLVQLNIAKAKDLLAFLLNDIDYYMRFYSSLFSETLMNETTSNLYVERIPFLVEPISAQNEDQANNPRVSLLKNLEEESMRRFTDVNWKKKISSAHKIALYREIAIMLSHKLNMSYRKNYTLNKISLYKLNKYLQDIKLQLLLKD